MAMTTGTSGPILTPEQVSDLVVQPVGEASTAMRVSRVVSTSSEDFRVPQVTADPTAAWTAEGAEITASDQALSEITVTPAKVAGLSIISRELADDSTPEASATVGAGLARDIAVRVDEAYFGALAAPAPSGLEALAGVQVIEDTSVSPAVAYTLTDLDHFADAISRAEQEGAQTTAFVTTPALALALSQLKTDGTSNEPLLGRDATAAGDRRVLGVPVLASPHVAPDVVWALPRAFCWVVMRDDTTVDVDRSVYFTSDRVAIRATMRVGFGFPHPASIVKIRVTP